MIKYTGNQQLIVNTALMDMECQQAIASGKSFEEVKKIYLRVKRIHALFSQPIPQGCNNLSCHKIVPACANKCTPF